MHPSARTSASNSRDHCGLPLPHFPGPAREMRNVARRSYECFQPREPNHVPTLEIPDVSRVITGRAKKSP